MWFEKIKRYFDTAMRNQEMVNDFRTFSRNSSGILRK